MTSSAFAPRQSSRTPWQAGEGGGGRGSARRCQACLHNRQRRGRRASRCQAGREQGGAAPSPFFLWACQGPLRPLMSRGSAWGISRGPSPYARQHASRVPPQHNTARHVRWRAARPQQPVAWALVRAPSTLTQDNRRDEPCSRAPGLAPGPSATAGPTRGNPWRRADARARKGRQRQAGGASVPRVRGATTPAFSDRLK